MGPRIDLNPDELALIQELFRIRFENNWTNSEVARQFEQKASRSISYQTLLNRYNNLGRYQVQVHEAPRTSREEPIERNFAEQNMSIENVVSIDEPRDSQSEHENIADVTVEIEQNMSILDVEDSNSNIGTELSVEDNLNPIANPVIEIINVNTNSITPTNVNRGRPRGRPRGSRRGRLTLQREEERNSEDHINRVTNETPQARQSRLERGLRNVINYRVNQTQDERNERMETDANRHRENIVNEDQETEIERLALENQRQRERRANETINELQNRQANQAERDRNRRANETEEQRERRLQYQRDYRRRIAEAETEADRLERLGLVHVRARQARFNLPTYRVWFRSNRPVDPQDNQGAPDQVCPHCSAKYWRNEVNSTGVYTKCCERNKIVIPRITQAHPTLVRLLGRDNQNPMDIDIRRNFINNIREYNSIFAMAAVLTNFDRADRDNHFNDVHRRSARGRPLPFLYRIHGTVYYKIAPMFNGIGGTQNLRAVQCLMMDSDQAILDAMERNFPLNVMLEANRLLRGTIQLIHRMLLDSNPLVQFFLTNREILQRQNREDPLTLRCWMTRNVPLNNTVPLNQQGQRQLATAPVHGEIAAVFSDFDGLPPEGTILYAQARELGMPLIGILAQRINNLLSQIDQRNPNCDPLCYPIIYVFGEAGYDERIQHNQAVLTRYSRVTMKEFYKFRFHFRDLTIELMFSMGKLFQEYIVHCWVKIEKNNLNYLRRNQANLRIHEYAGIMDHLNNPNADGVIGRAYILPSTFEGSDRAMRKHFYDGMELVGRFGKAHLFITFTANPQWPEIQNELQPGQSYLSRPDVCSRVYNLKFNEFWKDLVKDFKLGVVDAWLKTKEYQQRGLPHHHGAEIPDPVEDPELYELGATKMMHGPCRQNSPCMQKYGNRCSKGFPKNFSETTIIRDNNYPIYKRPNNGRIVMVNGVALNNRYVVEYPPEALRKFCCHINIQVVRFLASLKYVLKYGCKGNDRVIVVTHGLAEALRANPPQPVDNNDNQNVVVENDNFDVQVNRDVDPVFRNAPQEEQEAGDNRVDPVVPVVQEETYDEIRAYEEKRYVSSIEAFDRIMGFPRIEMSHSIHVLKIHLPGRQNIVFREAGIQNIANNVEPVTELIYFFRLNGRDVHARQFLYKDIVNHYVFDPTNKEWTRRVNDGSRLLLLHVRGATSYEHLRTVKDVVWPTFEAATMALNLVENNVQWHTTMEELAATELPYRLRFLFVTILIHNNPVSPNGLALWDNFQDAMSEDYREDDADTRIQKALGHLRYLLNGHGRTLADFNLPEPDERGLN
ncbi:unnamed protein product [Brachionus calyciflorus]|uniref:Helitron helicase-like domain-containing protein n=1 Tax=Brachionus calyciflorus TaxID=104777 RepID=A0A813VFR5_9BILA|nr:unnamed protein product [Brachionus calyciflorus]